MSLFTSELPGGAPCCWLPPPERVLGGGIRLASVTAGLFEVREFKLPARCEFGVLAEWGSGGLGRGGGGRGGGSSKDKVQKLKSSRKQSGSKHE